jgi:hypothetical protein
MYLAAFYITFTAFYKAMHPIRLKTPSKKLTLYNATTVQQILLTFQPKQGRREHSDELAQQ